MGVTKRDLGCHWGTLQRRVAWWRFPVRPGLMHSPNRIKGPVSGTNLEMTFYLLQAALEVCKEFLQEEEGKGVIMVTDPPFGGLVEPLAITFKKLIAMWKEGQSQDDSHKELPIFWIFPYFFESRICQFFPSFCMLDYQVDYDNHALYKHGKTGRKQSPVRIFTNVPPNKIILPSEEGYRFCSLCQRYVSRENQHCVHCNSCTSKDGRKWSHCFLCKKCVKPSWIHCNTCNRCALPDHSCLGPKDGCFICGALDHKRSNCPNIGTSWRANKAVRKQKQRKRNKIRREALKDNPWITHLLQEEGRGGKGPSISSLLNVQWLENKQDL